MTSGLAVAVVAAPLGFLLVTAIASPRRGHDPGAVKAVGAIACWAGVVVAAVAGILTAANGRIETPLVGWEGLGLSLRLDGLSAVMFAMIAVLALVIFRFSSTYLDGNPRQASFLGRLAATIAAVQILVLAGNLVVLVAAWIWTSLVLHRLLVFHPDRPRAVMAARKKFIAARIGDAFLIVAAALLYDRSGTGDLEQILDGATRAFAAGEGVGGLQTAALCIVIAAVLKAAQFPSHGWLVEVMEAPTPVSALLHAGVLNAGPFLVLRMAQVVDGADAATTLLLAIGGLTAILTSIALLTQPAIKVGLGYSSAAHMGFSLLLCGLGLFPAALLHLTAHSFYKAHAFLASGSVIDQARSAPVAVPGRLASPARIAGSFAIAVSLYVGFAAVWGTDLAREPELLAIGAVIVLAVAQLVAPALDSTGPASAVARTGILAFGVTAAFFVLETGAHELLAGTVPEITGREPLHFVVLAGILAAFAAVVVLQIVEPGRRPSRRRQRLAIHFRNGLYANAAFDRAIGALRLR